MTEIWKDIEGFEGFYQVSNIGRIKSIAVRRSLHGKIHIINREKIMSPYDNGNGYYMVCLRNNGKRTPVAVHRLVAKAFLEEDPDRNVVNHIDHDTHNNNVENLEWVTTKENVNWSVDSMRKPKGTSRKSNTGEKYIHKRKNHYRVHFKKFNVEKCFKSLDEAVAFRDEFISIHHEYFSKVVA